jgi:two-component system response regulator DegU
LVILIVDDSARVREAIRTIVDNPGYQYFECDNGSKVLDLYREIRPDWVLMDIKMPGINGIQATRDVKAEFPDARIVIVTNFDDEEFRDAADEVGARAYILKEDLIQLRDICI